MLALGERIADRYRVDELLGEGGFSAVYAATDLHSDRAVALKCFRPDRPDGYEPRTRARFQREVEMVARLRSPHTVRLFDHGESATGLLYMVLERIEGEDLDVRLRRVGHLDVTSALHILEQLLEAVGEAHAMGLLHRDIKSSNVRVFEYMGDALTVKLLDFGLARGTDGGHPGVTATGEFVGTPRYMAPEQLLDEPLTPATDIYCLGLVTYEMIFGLDVLQANSVHHQVERLRTGHLIAPRAREGLSAGLVEVLEKMTARDPAARYHRVADVVKALQNPPDPATMPLVRARPPTSAPPPEASRRWWPAAAVLTVAVVAAGVFVFQADAPAPRAPAPKRVVPAIVAQPASDGGVDPEEDVRTVDMPLNVPDVAAGDVGIRCAHARSISGHADLAQDPLLGETWLAYVPPDLAPDVPAPLVILLHQQGHNARTFLTTSGFVAAADAHGFVLVAPNDPDFEAWEPSEEHVAQIEALRDEALESLCVDRGRIFLVGHGSGGALADRVMCEGWVRGFATHAVPRGRDDIFCEPIRPVPFLQFYPKDSGYEPYHGGTSSSLIERESVFEIEARWRKRNHCKRRPRRKTKPGKNSECYEFDCETPFSSCHVAGGHGWPGTPRRTRKYELAGGGGPQPDPKFPMAELIGAFFEKLKPMDPL